MQKDDFIKARVGTVLKDAFRQKAASASAGQDGTSQVLRLLMMRYLQEDGGIHRMWRDVGHGVRLWEVGDLGLKVAESVGGYDWQVLDGAAAQNGPCASGHEATFEHACVEAWRAAQLVERVSHGQ